MANAPVFDIDFAAFRRNMMRKDGPAHQVERKAIFPTVSPKTVKNVWRACFERSTSEVIRRLKTQQKGGIVTDFAMPVSAEALKAMTGLTNMTWQQMDRVSQGMIDGCAHYAGDPEIEARCNDCTASIDRHISERIRQAPQDDDMSLLAVRGRAGLSDGQMRANIKLAISGGQNEPRDAIAGIARALLEYPDALADLKTGEISYLQVFEEFTRWIAPIGMSPRKITQPYEFKDIRFDLNDRVFLMFGSGNRDESIFENPNAFNPHRDTSKSITFGAGPHFCAGSWASKSLIVDVALPMLLEAFPSLKLTAEITFTGWAFRGPLSVPAEW